MILNNRDNHPLALLLFVICHLSFVIYSTALAVEYDGIWFLGFNLKSPVFKHTAVRSAVDRVIQKEVIAKNIISAEVVPVSVIPPGMLGYDPDLSANPYNIKSARALLKMAGFSLKDQQLKSITLLHTDGLKTAAIVDKLKDNLKDLGIKIKPVSVKYQNQSEWANKLASGKYDLFLMGYKAAVEQLFTPEASTEQYDSYSLVDPLFQSQGEANFTGFKNSKVDQLLDQVSGLNLALKSERHAKLKEINQIAHKDLPIIVLFYIEKL